MIWKFPPNEGGQEDGFHNPGVETFKGNLQRYLAREVLQNSLDARDDPKKPVTVKFHLQQLSAAEVPDIEPLRATLRLCWKYFETDPKATEFFKKAERLAKADEITALRICDFNTTGVPGTDTDRAKGWYSLIRCSGSSSKLSGEGGSFGIGKYAPFAASQLRTVLYSTLSEDGHAFQGVAKLVSHEHPKGGIAQATGYLGGKKTESIRDKKLIPRKFLRSKQGTDLVILGYDAQKQQWQKDLIYSVLENFWPAIHWKSLIVQVGDIEISSDNLSEMLEEFSSEEEFVAHHYYRAYTAETKAFTKILPTLKKVEVKLLAGDPELPKRVAMVRKTGMVIFHKQFKSILPYCGVFTCRNQDGNDILRQMEPPRHDEWSPNNPEKGSHKRTEAEFVDFIRSCIKQLAPTDNAKVLTLSELSQYLPDDEDSDEETFDDELTERSEKESFDRKPEIKPIKTRKIEQEPPKTKTEEDTNDGLGNEDEGGDDDDNSNEGGGGGGGGGGGEGGDGGGGPAKQTVPLKYRVFPKDLAKGIYSVTVESLAKSSRKVMIRIAAVGDDLTAPIGIEKAMIAGSKSVDTSDAGLIGPITLPRSGSVQIEITLSEPQRLAMEVEAYEA